jgi:cobalt-zinc-cadmium efflux system protein
MSPTLKLDHVHNHFHEGHATGKNIATAFFLNILFCFIEVIGGILTNSVAILSDALHDLGDSFSLGLAWYLQKVSARKPDKKFTYGYGRFTILSALINSVILLTGSVFVLTESIKRILEPAQTNAGGMMVLAIIGVLVNGFAVLRLRKGESLNEKVVSLHLLEDVLGWVAVLAGSIIMQFADLPVLDPILSTGISIYILFNVFRNLRSAFRMMLQGMPGNIDEKLIRESLLELPNVVKLHDLHIWSLDSEYTVLTIHLVVEDGIKKEEQQALRTAAHFLLKRLAIQHSTIEIEEASEICEWCEPDSGSTN